MSSYFLCVSVLRHVLREFGEKQNSLYRTHGTAAEQHSQNRIRSHSPDSRHGVSVFSIFYYNIHHTMLKRYDVYSSPH